MTRGAPFTTDWLGTSPLHLAAQYGHLTTTEVLIRAGISRDARTKVDKTPLHVAAQEGHSDIVELLLKNGADVDARDMLRMTALHWATERGHVHTVATLLKFGANVDSDSKFDKSPLEIASDNGRPDIYEMLQNADQLRMSMSWKNESETEAATQAILGSPDPHNSNDATPQETSDAAMKLLEAHGITLLPEDSSTCLPVADSGQTLALTEAGKLALGISSSIAQPTITSSTSSAAAAKKVNLTKIVTLSSSSVPTTPVSTTTPSKQTKVIKLTSQQFAALRSGGGLNISNLMNTSGEKRKLDSSSVIGGTPQRKTIKIVQIKPNTQVVKTLGDNSNAAALRKKLEEAERAKEMVRLELKRKEEEAQRLRKQLESLTN